MDEGEFRLLLFGAGITMAFLGMRVFLDWDAKRINFKIGHNR